MSVSKHAQKLLDDEETRLSAAALAEYMEQYEDGDLYAEALERLKALEKIQDAANEYGLDTPEEIREHFDAAYEHSELGADAAAGLGHGTARLEVRLFRAGLMAGHGCPWEALDELLERVEDFMTREHFAGAKR